MQVLVSCLTYRQLTSFMVLMMTARSLDQPAMYQIRIQGVLPVDWQVWFNGMQLSDDGRVTTLQGIVPDQPALFGLLIKIRDLGLTIISVQRLDDDPGRS